MFERADLMEEAAWDEPVRCRQTATRRKPPQRYSPRFEKPRRTKNQRAAGMKLRGTRQMTA